MQTHPTLGINNELADEPEVNFTSATVPTFEIDNALPGPETTTPKAMIEAQLLPFQKRYPMPTRLGLRLMRGGLEYVSDLSVQASHVKEYR